MSPRVVSLALWVGALCLHGAALAQNRPAPESRAIQRARAFAREHNVNVRLVETGPPNRRVVRAFVPVTEQTFKSFFQHFNADHGFVAFRYTERNNHVTPCLKAQADGTPADCYLWGLNYNRSARLPNNHSLSDHRNLYMTPQNGGWIAAADLQGPMLTHLQSFLQRNEQSGERLFRENCMKWMGNAEVGADRMLFPHALGLRRSLDGHQIARKLIHASNERVQVFGVRVDSAQAFDAMTDAQLIGPEPHAGVEAAVHQ